MKSDISGVVFDVNGTMMFDSRYHREVWRDIIKRMTGNELSDAEINANLIGRDNRGIITRYLGDGMTEDEMREFGQKKEAEYRERCKNDPENFRLVEGLTVLLDKLKNNGIPMNIATGSDLFNIRFYFEYFGFDRWFDFDKVVFDNGTFPGKPAADIYIIACSNIGLTPPECLVFEDSVSGVRAANNAKAGHVIAINEKEGKSFYDAGGGVDYADNSFLKIPEILGI